MTSALQIEKIPHPAKVASVERKKSTAIRGPLLKRSLLDRASAIDRESSSCMDITGTKCGTTQKKHSKKSKSKKVSRGVPCLLMSNVLNKSNTELQDNPYELMLSVPQNSDSRNCQNQEKL